MTVMDAVPLFPSLVAVMVAEPGAIAVTNPFEETVAIEPLDVDQATDRPVRTLPFASRTVACNCVVCPVWMLAEGGAMLTDATGAGGGGGGAVTVIAAVPLFPSLVAVMVAEPAATPVTKPLEETVATEPLDVVHVMARPVSTLPLASRSVA